MSAPYRRLSVSLGASGRQQFAVNCRRMVVLTMSGPFSIRLEAEGNASIPVNRPGKVVDCKGPVSTLYVDIAADQVVAGGTVELLLTDDLVMDFESLSSSSPTAQLVNRWQAPTSGYVGGALGALRDSTEMDMQWTGANVTGDTVYLAAAGSFTARMNAIAAAGAWGRVFPIRMHIDGPLSGLHPTNAIPAALRLARPELFRLDFPVHMAALANTGVIGSENECRVHVGLGTSWTQGGLGCHWPGPGVFFVTKANTQTWAAVIAAANRGAPGVFRQQYVTTDTGISYLVPHILTVQAGFQASGVVIVQWAIDNQIVMERATRLAALLNPADWTPWPLNQGLCPGISVDSELLADTLEVHYAYGPGVQLWRDDRVVTPGQL